MAISFRALVALLFFALSTPIPVRATPQKASIVGAEAIDGHSLRLRDGTQIRLAGILAPSNDARAGRAEAEQARRHLQRLVQNRALSADPPADRRDRHGRLLLHLHDSDGAWLQGEMLRAGHARVFTQADAAERTDEMLQLESEARVARKGLWALPYFAILTEETAAGGLDRFQIVEAAIRDVARVRGTVFLNTGADWRTDFTVRIERPALRLLAAAGIDPATLQGKKMRVRGWLRSYNGPLIDVTHPQQIEVIDP